MKLADPSPLKAVVVGEGDVPLRDILQGKTEAPLDLEAFRKFCKKRLVEENLDFWLQVEFTLKRTSNRTDFIKHLEDICKLYVVDNAEKEINIPTTIKKSTLAAVENIKKNDAGIDTHILQPCQEHVFHMMESDVFPGFKKAVIIKQRLSLSKVTAMWWKQKDLTLKEFFSFPNPINAAEARTHFAITILYIVGAILTHYYTGIYWVFVPMLYGFVARLLCGPRLDPQAFLVLFVLAPFFTRHLKVFKNEFVAGPPKRFAQFVGMSFTLIILILLIFNQSLAAYIVAAVFLFAALLGFLFDFCLACETFKLGMKLGIVPASVCQECAIQYIGTNESKPAACAYDPRANLKA